MCTHVTTRVHSLSQRLGTCRYVVELIGVRAIEGSWHPYSWLAMILLKANSRLLEAAIHILRLRFPQSSLDPILVTLVIFLPAEAQI